MIRKRFINLTALIVLLLVITGCGKDQNQEITFKKGFPKEDSRGLTEFMKSYLTGSTDKKILEENDVTLFSTVNHQGQAIRYFQYTQDQLKVYYKPLFTAKKPKTTLNSLYQIERLEKLLHHPIQDKEKYHLPAIKMLSNNQLQVKTKKNKKTLDLPKLLKNYGVKKSDELEINLYAVNSKCFSVVIQDFSMKDRINSTIGLFITQDLTNIESTVITREKLQNTLSKGKLKDYYDLFTKVDKSGRYLLLFFDDMILDKRTNQLIDIKKDDYLSKDGKYVYINGAKEQETNVMPDGIQQIQTVDNYLKGNEKYEAQFKIDFKQIAKEMDFNAGDARIANIQYFNKDYVVLYISYHGKTIGTAGSVNVLIDLQKNKQQPTAYLVDLGIES
ncbi:hypothetical protein [Bacillus licheniformis]|uniref:hypothetical protein n=1 Tax=Bacillus licheniformis TaxID=1402 RepID=UPI001C22B6D5|nr:hypothetical protein [Bacillus licheniformis]MBU8737570.1 hypothetical protein [Bacillus licheniformis]